MKKEISKDTSKQMVIETPQLMVKGNIMTWQGTMIQLSNVSCISTRPLTQTVFPMYSIALLFIGVLLFEDYLMASIISFGIGVALIYKWYITNKERKKNTILDITMNSGNNLQIVFYEKDFLNKVLDVLERIIIDGGLGKQNLTINIEKCKFGANAKLLNDLKLL